VPDTRNRGHPKSMVTISTPARQARRDRRPGWSVRTGIRTAVSLVRSSGTPQAHHLAPLSVVPDGVQDRHPPIMPDIMRTDCRPAPRNVRTCASAIAVPPPPCLAVAQTPPRHLTARCPAARERRVGQSTRRRRSWPDCLRPKCAPVFEVTPIRPGPELRDVLVQERRQLSARDGRYRRLTAVW
jgi:hypothetical protein